MDIDVSQDGKIAVAWFPGRTPCLYYEELGRDPVEGENARGIFGSRGGILTHVGDLRFEARWSEGVLSRDQRYFITPLTDGSALLQRNWPSKILK